MFVFEGFPHNVSTWTVHHFPTLALITVSVWYYTVTYQHVTQQSDMRMKWISDKNICFAHLIKKVPRGDFHCKLVLKQMHWLESVILTGPISRRPQLSMMSKMSKELRLNSFKNPEPSWWRFSVMTCEQNQTCVFWRLWYELFISSSRI